MQANKIASYKLKKKKLKLKKYKKKIIIIELKL